MTNYVPAVDYTSRDYSAILSDMLALLPAFSNGQWTSTNPNDVATILIELFAYMGDIMSYYIDRSANEAMINTASQRQSLLDIANLLGYIPTLATPATGTVTFKNTGSSPITVPALTQVTTSLVSNATTTQIIFETSASVVVPASTATIALTSANGVPLSTSTSVIGTSGTTTLTVTSPNPSVIVAGMQVTGTGIPANTYVTNVTGTGPYTVTISNSLTATAIGTYTFGAVAQYTSGVAHGLTTGQSVTITGYGTAGYNVSGATVYVASTTTFTVNNTTVGTTTGTGSVSYAVAGGNNEAAVAITQGQTVANEVIGTSNGQPFQIYQLANTNVINNSVSIVINGVTYAPVPYLVDYGALDPVFSTLTDETGITYIKFGDGASGRIPPSGVQIFATYRVGGGTIGNVSSGLIKYILNLPGYSAVPSGLSLDYGKSTATTGGSDPESNDSIRFNAPLALRALNRAVTVPDHASVATQVVGVAKASAQASNYSAVTIYVLPQGDYGVSSADNSTPTDTFNKKAKDVDTYLSDKISPSTTVTVQPPSWVGCYLETNITVDSAHNQTSVKTNVTTALQNLYYVDNVNFNKTVALSDIYQAINSVPGVQGSKIVKHVRADQDQTYTTTLKALTSGVATITMSGTAAIPIGSTIRVSGVDSTFNGVYTATASTYSSGTVTVSYSLAASNVTSTAATSGTVTVLTVGDVTTAVNEIPTMFYLGTTASSATPWVGSLTVNASGGVV